MNELYSSKQLEEMTDKELKGIAFLKDIDRDNHLIKGSDLGYLIGVLEELKEEENILENPFGQDGSTTDEMIEYLEQLLEEGKTEGFYVLSERAESYKLEHYTKQGMIDEILYIQEKEMEEMLGVISGGDEDKIFFYSEKRYEDISLETVLEEGLDVEFSLQWFEKMSEANRTEMEAYAETAKKLKNLFN